MVPPYPQPHWGRERAIHEPTVPLSGHGCQGHGAERRAPPGAGTAQHPADVGLGGPPCHCCTATQRCSAVPVASEVGPCAIAPPSVLSYISTAPTHIHSSQGGQHQHLLPAPRGSPCFHPQRHPESATAPTIDGRKFCYFGVRSPDWLPLSLFSTTFPLSLGLQYLQVDFVEELSNPMMSPVFSQMWQDVPKSIRPGRKGVWVRLIQPGGCPTLQQRGLWSLLTAYASLGRTLPPSSGEQGCGVGERPFTW